jgi:hypothetical protein
LIPGVRRRRRRRRRGFELLRSVEDIGPKGFGIGRVPILVKISGDDGQGAAIGGGIVGLPHDFDNILPQLAAGYRIIERRDAPDFKDELSVVIGWRRPTS